MFRLGLCAALMAAPAVAVVAGQTEESYVFPLAVHNGSATPLTREVGSRPLDTTYITSPNSSTYEWWYFDAVAADLSASVVLQPVVEGGAFVLVLDLQYINASGDKLTPQFMLPYSKGYFSSTGYGSSMTAADGQWSYTSTPDLSCLIYQLNIPTAGVSGTVKFKSIATPHVACSGIHDDARLDFYWNLFRVNVMPDAVATVDLMLNGTKVVFEGIGYHDKNWAPTPYNGDFNQWYWGHGRAGAYSVVWFYRLNPKGELTTSAYVAKDNAIVYVSCAGVVVRPFNANGTVYPIPYPFNSSSILGLELSIDAGALGIFVFTAMQKHDVLFTPSYHRLTGTFTGGLVGHGNATGIALWEIQGPFAPGK